MYLPSTSNTAPPLPSHHHRASTTSPLPTAHQNPTRLKPILKKKTHLYNRKKKKNRRTEMKPQSKQPACSDPKGGFCIPWNSTSPREAHENVFIRNDLPLMSRGLFPHYCVLWGRTKPWGVWDPKTNNIYKGGVGLLHRNPQRCDPRRSPPNPSPIWATRNPQRRDPRRSPPNPSPI